MAEPVTDDDEYGQITLVNAVTPLSHSFSDFDYSPIIRSPPRFSVLDGWTIQQVPHSTEIPVDGNSTDQRMITSGGIMTPLHNWSYAKFTVPEDWYVEKVPRKSGSSIDTYYYDPQTGRKFRSLKEVERYVTEGIIPKPRSARRLKYHEKSCGGKRKTVSGVKVNVKPTSYRSRSSLDLPDGWIVECVPRKSGDHIDRYYYEPGTGQKFRSLPSVREHLAELEENNLPLSKAFKLPTSKKNHGSLKNSVSKTDQASSLNNLPSKINWVMSSSGGESWNAFVDDSPVPDRLRQQWGRRFMSHINNNNPDATMSG